MSLNDKLFSIASSAVEKQRKTRDSRSAVSKGFDVATNKSYVNEDKKVAAKALREWENKTWKPKIEAKLKQELRARAPHLKPGSPKYNQTYESLFNKNHKDLQAAKAEAQQRIGTLRKPKQTQRELDNEYRTNESIRNNTVGTQAVAHAARDTVSAVGGALATGTSRLLRAPLQLAADVGENDDGGIFDRGAKALESYEDNISNNVYQAYGDIQQNGNFSQKLAVSAVEQVPSLAASFGAAGVAAKGVQAVGAGAKATAAASYGVAGASMYPQAYLDGSDSTKDELENATAEQLASAERSQDIYKGMFDKNIKAGMSEDDAHAKARDQTISEIAEESGENVGLATLALSMMAPGVGSFTANRAAGGAVSQWGQKVFNRLAVRADASKAAKYAIPTAVGAGIVGLNVAEEGLQEGYTDYVAQQAAVDVGVKEEIDRAQSTEAVLMGGILGGLMGGATYVGTRNSKLKQAQDGLKAAQQSYADIASTIPQLQEQITAVSPRSAEGQALTVQLEQTKAALSAMTSEAERRGIPRTSLARRAPRIEPSNSTDQEFDGQVDGATELDEQGFEDALNPQGTPTAPAQLVVDSQPSEQELDAQDAQIAELIAEQQALDEAIEDGSNDKPVEQSLAEAQAWYDNKRGENKQGLSGVVSRAAAKVEDAAFAEQQQAIAGTGATINDYIAAQRAQQAQIDAEIEQAAADAKTERERQAAEQLKQQRKIERAEAEAAIAKRAELAQPYENEAFDTTVVGADGTPFNLARFWDSTMPAAAKTKAIADAFNGEIDQNVAKAGWGDMPEGVQKQVHQWMTGQLDAVRQRRAGGDTQAQPISEPPLAPQSQQSVAPTASGLTMPAQQAPSATTKRRKPSAGTVAQQEESLKKINEELENYTPAAPVETDTATQLTDENPTINIPAPTQAKVDVAPTTDEGIYKSKPAARAAIKKQKLDPDSVSINQVKGGGFEIVANAPAKPTYEQAQQQAATELGMTLDENGEYGGTDAEFEAFANRVDEIQGRTLGGEESIPQQTSEAPKTSSENRSPEVQDLAATTPEVIANDTVDTTEQSNTARNAINEEPVNTTNNEDNGSATTLPSNVVEQATSKPNNNLSVKDIAQSYDTVDSRVSQLEEKLKGVQDVAKLAGVKINTAAKYYQEAYNDASKMGSINPNKTYIKGRMSATADYSIAAAEAAGAIEFVKNDNVEDRKRRDLEREQADSARKSKAQEEERKAVEKKESEATEASLVKDVFDLSLDDIKNLVYRNYNKLQSKAKRTKDAQDEKNADRALRKARQSIFDVQDAVIDYAKGDMDADEFLTSKAGEISELAAVVKPPQSSVEKAETAPETKKPTAKTELSDNPSVAGDWQTQVNGNEFRINEDGVTVRKHDRVVHIRGASSIVANQKAKELANQDIRELHYIAAKDDVNDPFSEGSIWLNGEGDMVRKKGTKKPTGSLLPILKQAKGTTKSAPKKSDQPTTTTEPVTEIEDFGEKITGARKDMDSFYQKEMTDDDIISQPLSKIWPKKDIDAIENKQTAALATVLRGTIPSKPRKGYKLNNWVAQVKSARGIMQQMLSDNASAETFIDQMTKVKGLQSTGYHAQLLSAIEQDQWARVTAVDHRPYYAIQNDDGSTSPDMSFDVTIDKRRHIIPTENKKISEVVDKVNELLSGEVKAPTLKFDLYSRGRGDKRSYFITQASDKDKTPLIEFNDRDAARAFLRDNNNDLSELWNQHKEKVNVKKTDTRSKQNRERIGPDHRGGQDVTTEQFMEAFGLRGGQFGNWVKQGANSKERQGMLNDAYDAFMDLAGVLNIPPEAIGLGGKLGMSFGARGKGAAMAHYEPSQVVINLTKTKGAGTLAHEWFHALDHHFTSFRDSPARNKSREDTYITYKPEPAMMYTPQKGRGYLLSKPALEKRRAKSDDPMYSTENWAPDPNHPAGVRPKVEEAFADLVNALNDSPMKERANTIDKGATDGYWSRIIERAARAFESYVINKLDKQGARSDFLANVTPEDAFPRNMDRYPYLLESEMAPVAEAFDNLFATIDSKPSEDGNSKILFSRAGQMQQIAKDIKNNPAKGLTGTTSQQVISLLQDRFGKEAVAQLIKAGKLRVRTLNDFVNSNGRLLIPSDAEGFYHQGKVVLIADNLTTDTAVATLLHELGGHAGIQSMLSTQTYMGLMENFYDLVRSGNKYAVRAKQRAEASTYSASEARDEYIPYLITEYAQATERGGPLAVIKRFVNRVVAGVRAWVRNNTGVQLKITPNDITQLAERMVKRLAEQSMDSVTIAGMDNTAAMPQYSQETTNQTATPAFKKWFGDSKVVDGNGKPLVVYHGTNANFNTFSASDIGIHVGTEDQANSRAEQKEGGDFKLMPLYVKAENPLRLKDARSWKDPEWYLYESGISSYLPTSLQQKISDFAQENRAAKDLNTPEGQKKAYEKAMAINSEVARFLKDELGYDSIVYANTHDGTTQDNKMKADDSWIVFDPEQIKSTTNNNGTFDGSNPDIRFSRRYSSLGTDGKPTTAKERARDRLALAQATTMSSKFGINLLLRRHLATPQHVALLNPIFKIFTDNVQARIAYENNEAGLVQSLLPEIWDTRLIMGKKKEAMERVSKAIFDGTMADKVWSDTELQTMFDLTDQDIDFYRRTRQAIDESVLNMTIDTLSSLAKGTKLVNINTVGRLKLARLTPDGHSAMLQQYMTDELEKLAKGGLISAKAEARMQKQLNDVFDVMSAVAGKSEKLAEQGYAPLMRFGNYAVEVRDKTTNELDLFELYETKGQQRKAIKELKERYDENQFEIGTGTLNPEGFKQFKNKGLSPETVQLFAAELGLDEDGAHQAYLKIAISDRSALKRLIHRKKVPGYSEDMPRVLSSFVMSNARYSGRSLYNGEIERSIQNIEDGNLQNEAQKVFENMENPQEEFAQQRSMMFFYFMGFSPAFFFLNLTQPVTQTIPKLTAYVGVGKSHAYMAQALGIVGKHMTASAINMGKNAVGIPTPNWKGFEDNLPAWVKKEDYLRMAREGHLDPQNIFMIKGLERGKGGVASGVWGNIEAAAGWFAEVSESINRRSTMIAALRVAKDMSPTQLKAKGFDNKYDFAVSVIQQTQGIYNKANRSGLARGNGKLGQYGPLILVFKQFTINYTEQMIRHGRDKEAKSIAVAMAWQFGLAGMLGLPFADDLRDIVEGLLYRLFGKAFNLPDYLEGLLGKSNADALMYGIASEKGRIDLFGRSSLGNIIPGTDVARPGPTDWAEILGASSGFYESFFSAAAMATEGHYKDALITASPRFVRDAASGVEIAMTGSYRNTKGDKIMDLDKTDAVIKSLAFNPANNAKPGRDRSNAYNMKNMLKAKTDYFSKHLAEAMYQEDDDRIDELYIEMDTWNDKNAEHFNVDIDKIEASAEKRVERKDFGSAERQNIQDSLAQRQEDLAGT